MEEKILSPNEKLAIERIINKLTHEKNPTDKYLMKLKREYAKRYKLNRFVKNSEILYLINKSEDLGIDIKERLKKLLLIRRIRTISGIAVIAVMTKPVGCPGNCLFCPTIEDAPKSYTGKEPAALRGAQNDFDPRRQVEARMHQLESIGHTVDKVHLVIMGGTFLSMPPEYQTAFITDCLNGITGKTDLTIEAAQISAETSIKKNVGITVETRPDYSFPRHINQMLKLGGTWVEIGVQSLSDEILNLVKRNHSVDDVRKAIQSARDGGLKITVHMMPNLFQTPEEDLEMFNTLFYDERFIPDALKIYPTLVLRHSELYDWWKRGDYKPYSEEKIIDLISKVKSIIPPYIRIQRIQRDIPAYLIEAGVKSGNLRELAKAALVQRGKVCKCIRCREIGHQINLGKNDWKNKDKKYFTRSYKASNGYEHFISYETKDEETLFGFLRLREPSVHSFRSEVGMNQATIIRELHVYGQAVGIGKDPKLMEWQHRGIGKELIELAENITENEGYKKILVTSGIGVRDYYKKFGFKREGVYMGKKV